MNILTITGWIGVIILISGICLILSLIFGLLVVNEIDLRLFDAEELFNKINKYSIVTLLISALLLGIIYSYTWMSLGNKFGNSRDEYVAKINETFAYLVSQRIEDRHVSVDNIIAEASLVRDIIANICSEGFQSEGCVKLINNKVEQVVDSIEFYTKKVDKEIKQLKGE